MRSFSKGNYDYLPGIPFLSFGARAHEGYDVVRVRVEAEVDASDALDAIAPYVAERSRPLAALCGIEFRQFAERQMTRDEFNVFNAAYVRQLREAGISQDDEVPVARTNVVVTRPGTRGVRLHAFSFTVPTGAPGGSDFVLSAIPEVRFSDAGEEVIESGGTTAQAFGRKLDYILNLAHGRMAEIGSGWDQVTAAQLYAAGKLQKPADPALEDQFGLPRSCGITWVDAVPPIGPSAIEMDLRRTSQEDVLRRY